MQLNFPRRLFALVAVALTTSVTNLVSAVQLSANGEGEVLLFPYYSVRNGAATLISLVNTSNTTSKLVTVQFLEAKNAAEVLDFTLYLSKGDVWTGAIIASPTGAKLVSNDTSCTNPTIRTQPDGVSFRNTGYAGDQGELRSEERVREGQIHVFARAAITAGSPTDLDISPDATGVRRCQLTNNLGVSSRQDDYGRGDGGLAGSVSIIGNSMSWNYQPVALTGMNLFSTPNAALYGLGSEGHRTATIQEGLADGSSRIIVADFTNPLDSISAVLMRSSLFAEYSSDELFATDWIVSFPTKRPHVQFAPARPPFQSVWNNVNGTACDDASYSLKEREAKPVADNVTTQLCWSTNAISVKSTVAGNNPSLLRSTNQSTLSALGAITGTGSIDLTVGAPPLRTLVSLPTSKIHTIAVDGSVTTRTGRITFRGLPAIGLAFYGARFTSANDNYGSSVNLLGRPALITQE